MSGETNDVFVGGYKDIGAASKEFDALAEAVAGKKVKLEAAILITHDTDGTVNVRQTVDHRGRKGAEWGAGVGFLVGLAAPPVLAATAIGAAIGGLGGKGIDKKLQTQMHDTIGEHLPAGTAGIIAVFDDEQRLAVEQTLPNALAKSIVQTDKDGVRALKDGLADAMHKFVPDRTKLPIPSPSFGGTMGESLDRSVGDWTILPGPKPPAGAPNVLLILIDDAGFGAIDSFGGLIETPNFTRVGQQGMYFNRFHVTAVCSPTRAAMLTGRNHHQVGMGTIAELPGPYPGYTGERPNTCAALPRILKENGYATAAFGKWHMTPGTQMGAAGPTSNWPLGWGFDHYYGFLTGAAGQYDPLITVDNTTIGPQEGKDGQEYYFPEDMTDKSIEWLQAVRAADPEKPWFMYYSTGCAHAPHHVQKEWADKYKGTFDMGWDKYREETLARQKKLGLVPEDTVLSARPDLFPAWDSLNEDQKKLYARQMEVIAGYQAVTDWHVGRVLDAVEALGETDNTLILYIWGDNGASMEGTLTGSFNETTFFNGEVLDATEMLKIIDEKFGGIDAWGGFYTAPHYAAAWAHASNTPFQWGKQMGSHLGGTRDPMVVSWPERFKAKGDLRTQFTHCIDIAPTILELVGIPEPTQVDGIEQVPMAGTSFAYTLDDAAAEERHTVQYFEMLGSRAIYKDGWWACAKLDKLPWDFSQGTLQTKFAPGKYDPEKDRWELYYLPDDFSQAHDLAADKPDTLAELKELFHTEGEKYNVFPLLGAFSMFLGDLPPLPTVNRHTFGPTVQNIQTSMIPRIYNRSYALEGELYVPKEGAEGVIVAFADFIGGFSLWIDEDGMLNHTYQYLGIDTYKQTSTKPVPTGDVTVKMLFEIDEPKPGSGGKVTLWANDDQIGEGRLEKTCSLIFTTYAGMDIGRDNGGVVDLAYEKKAPYAFTGTIKNVVVDLAPATPKVLSHEQEKELHKLNTHVAVAAGVHG
ncbi:MAG TPA: arylsulfatase [Actinomycetota bacterium]|nr:arylsulfatase [Actinomycetota bacterium]